jgi:hypothetical protein
VLVGMVYIHQHRQLLVQTAAILHLIPLLHMEVEVVVVGWFIAVFPPLRRLIMLVQLQKMVVQVVVVMGRRSAQMLRVEQV